MMQNNFEAIEFISSWDIPVWIEYLDKIAGNLFTCSFVISKIRDLPLGPLSMALSIVTLSLFGTAYTIQIFTSSYYQNAKISSNREWSYRELYMTVAFIGASTCWLTLGFPSCWVILMLIGTLNTFLWYAAELCRLENPTAYPQMTNQPEFFIEYVKWIAISSLISTIALLLALSMPGHFMLIYITGLVGNYMASGLAIQCLLESFQSPQLDTDETIISKNIALN